MDAFLFLFFFPQEPDFIFPLVYKFSHSFDVEKQIDKFRISLFDEIINYTSPLLLMESNQSIASIFIHASLCIHFKYVSGGKCYLFSSELIVMTSSKSLRY